MPTILGVPYPAMGDAANLPSDLYKAIEALAPRQVFPVASGAERDSLYGDLPAGALVTTTGAPWRLWLKTSDTEPSWRTLHYDSGKVTTGITPATGWAAGSYAWVREINGVVFVNVELVRSGDEIQASNDAATSPGNVPDQRVVNIPPEYAPDSYISVVGNTGTALGALTIYTTGSVNLISLNTSGKVANGDFLRFTASYPKAS